MGWTDPGKEQAYQKAYRAAHRDELRDYGRAYYAANKEESLAYQKIHRRVNKTRIASRNREAKYGLKELDFIELCAKQNGACAICKMPFTETPQVDHDHRCCGEERACYKCRRGLLCKHCNRGIGCLQDSIEIIGSAIAYLNQYGSGTRQ